MRTISILLICMAAVFIQISFIPQADIVIVGIILAVFFYTDKESMMIALIGGSLRDMVYPTFGFHLIMYPVVALIGALALKTIISHRTLGGFISFSLVEILSADLLKIFFQYTVRLTSNNSSHFFAFGTPELFYVISNGCIVFGLSLLGYVFFERFHHTSRHGIVIERL